MLSARRWFPERCSVIRRLHDLSLIVAVVIIFILSRCCCLFAIVLIFRFVPVQGRAMGIFFS